MTDQVSTDTRQVVLAYPREIDGKQYNANDKVELPAEGLTGARQLVRDGRARWAPGTDDGRQPAARTKATGRPGATEQNGATA